MLQALDTSLRACSGDLQSGQSPPAPATLTPVQVTRSTVAGVTKPGAAVFAAPSPDPGLAGAAEGPGGEGAERAGSMSWPGAAPALAGHELGTSGRAGGHHPPACTHSWDPSPALASRGS